MEKETQRIRYKKAFCFYRHLFVPHIKKRSDTKSGEPVLLFRLGHLPLFYRTVEYFKCGKPKLSAAHGKDFRKLAAGSSNHRHELFQRLAAELVLGPFVYFVDRVDLCGEQGDQAVDQKY